MDDATEPSHLTFAFADDDGRVTAFSRLFGVTPTNRLVEITGPSLRVTFGPWRVVTPVANVERVEIEGPYHWIKIAGPARYSVADHSLTFATTTRRGAAISFKEPIRGLDPFGRFRHPSLTVTVDDPEALADALMSAPR